MSVSNFVRTTIKNSVSSGATTIDVDTASSPFNNPPAPDDHARLFLVDSLDSPTKWEEIEYTGRSAISGGFQLTGVTRNEDSSTGSAQSFDAGHYVVMQPSATTDGQGAIVESGTNSNGSYVRWENGEQVCFGQQDFSAESVTQLGSTGIYRTGNLTITWPKSFSTYSGCNAFQHTTDKWLGGGSGTGTTISVNVVSFQTASADYAGTISFVAWGFWK